MPKVEALAIIDAHKNRMVDPTEILRWTWLRVIINQIPEKDWEGYLEGALVVLAR